MLNKEKRLKLLKFRLLMELAEVFELTGAWEKCQQLRKDGLDLAIELKDKVKMGLASESLGWILGRKCEYQQAMIYYQQAIQWLKDANDKKGIVKAAKGMGVICYYRGDFEMALTCYDQSYKYAQELGDQAGMAKVINNIGDLHRSRGEYDQAMKYFKTTLEISEKIDSKWDIPTSSGNIGLVYASLGEYETAIEWYDRAIEASRLIDYKYIIAYFSIEKAIALYNLNKFEEAEPLNTEGLKIAEDIGNREYIFKGRILAAKLGVVHGNLQQAVESLMTTLQQTNDDAEQADLHYELYHFGVNAEYHRNQARHLYQQLLEKAPIFDYQQRLKELT